MRYYRYLYSSDSIHNIQKVKEKLNAHNGMVGIHIISLPRNNNQLEIMDAAFLKFPFYRKHPLVVVGITHSYDEAVDIVVKITEESIEKTGKASIKDYLVLRAKTRDFTIEA